MAYMVPEGNRVRVPEVGAPAAPAEGGLTIFLHHQVGAGYQMGWGPEMGISSYQKWE